MKRIFWSERLTTRKLLYRRLVGDALRSRCREHAMYFLCSMTEKCSILSHGHNRLESRVVGSTFECNNYTQIAFQVYDLEIHLNLSTMYHYLLHVFVDNDTYI